MKTHVVVTVYLAPSGKVFTHVYGTYTQSRANSERRKIMAEYEADIVAGRLRVTTNKVVDIDAMNAEAEK